MAEQQNPAEADRPSANGAERALRHANNLFETAFSEAPIGMALLALDGRWLKVNGALCGMAGFSEAELLERTFQEMTHPDDLDADMAQLEALLAGRIRGYQMEKRYIDRSGKLVWAHLSVSLVRDEEGRPQHFISQVNDITDRKESERRLLAAELEARTQRDHNAAIIRAMREGYTLTVDGEIKAVNEALCELTGFSEQELVGAHVPFPFWPPELLIETLDLRDQALERKGSTFEVTLMRKDGARFEAEITAQPAHDRDGGLLGYVSTIRDISVQRRHQSELERLARTDSLTGLSNRHVLQESLRREVALAGRDGQPVALILLDIDLFKLINDRYGHPVGDSVLIEVARRLESTVRAGEVLARIGGEEFAWLLPRTDAEGAAVAADRARGAIASQPFAMVGSVTISAGVSSSSGSESHEGLYRLADHALYRAKHTGRNKTVVSVAALTGATVD